MENKKYVYVMENQLDSDVACVNEQSSNLSNNNEQSSSLSNNVECVRFEFCQVNSEQVRIEFTLHAKGHIASLEGFRIRIYLVCASKENSLVGKEHNWLFFENPKAMEEFSISQSKSKSCKFTGSFILRNRVHSKDNFFLVFSPTIKCSIALSAIFKLCGNPKFAEIVKDPPAKSSLVLSKVKWKPPANVDAIDLTKMPSPKDDIVSLCAKLDALDRLQKQMRIENMKLVNERDEAKHAWKVKLIENAKMKEELNCLSQGRDKAILRLNKTIQKLELQSQQNKEINTLLRNLSEERTKTMQELKSQSCKIREMKDLLDASRLERSKLNSVMGEIEALEDELSCSICFDLFDSPVVLNCSHSFCSKCWESEKTTFAARKRKHGYKGRIFHECPTCRSKVNNNKPYHSVATVKIVDSFKKVKKSFSGLSTEIGNPR